MTARSQSNQIAFRYHAVDSATGASRATAKRLAEHLGRRRDTGHPSGAA